MDHNRGIPLWAVLPVFFCLSHHLVLCSFYALVETDQKPLKSPLLWIPYTVDTAVVHADFLRSEVHPSPSCSPLWRIVDEWGCPIWEVILLPYQQLTRHWHRDAKYQVPCLKIEPMMWSNSSSRAAHRITLKLVSSWDLTLALLSSSGPSCFSHSPSPKSAFLLKSLVQESPPQVLLLGKPF